MHEPSAGAGADQCLAVGFVCCSGPKNTMHLASFGSVRRKRETGAQQILAVGRFCRLAICSLLPVAMRGLAAALARFAQHVQIGDRLSFKVAVVVFGQSPSMGSVAIRSASK